MPTLIERLKLTNFLSFGPESEAIELGPLNVLIGANGSGKSNFIEAFAVLRAAERDLKGPLVQGGGVGEWLWKGSHQVPEASVEATVHYPYGPSHPPVPRVTDAEGRPRFVPWPHTMAVHYRLAFTVLGQRFHLSDEEVHGLRLVDEEIRNEEALQGWGDDPHVFYRYNGGTPIIEVDQYDQHPQFVRGYAYRASESIPEGELRPDQSVLSQRKDPVRYPELTYLGEQLSRIRLYREWDVGPYANIRKPQRADAEEDALVEGGGNLGLIVNDLDNRGHRRLLLEHLKRFYQSAEDLTVKVQGGTVQLYLHESGLLSPVPVTRLSDGTVKYLALLCILLHPEPPPLICIEEPELGLHPDIIGVVAELLIEASERTQLVVTTHSDLLVAKLSDRPEAVVVCDKDERGTHLRRLDPERLREWLTEYSLGDLWLKGQIGGTRW
ncbi:MAG: AAA family ATPase [Armatimonadetes bacterium]|nr:AAA family ATPase [Armatimonadota bacterium]